MTPTQVAVPAKTKSGERPMARILIVEDEPAMVAGLRDNFEFEGYDVITAPDGVAGLERALKEAPDLVILDVMMPRSGASRSEEHTSELQSPCNLVCRLLL